MVLVHALAAYVLWHYTLALQQAFGVWRNILWYVTHLFSLRTLTRTLFSPWKRMQEEYGGGFNPEHFFEIIVANGMSRVVGVLIRLPIILIGCAALVLSVCAMLLFYIGWLLFPFILFMLFATGIAYIV